MGKPIFRLEKALEELISSLGIKKRVEGYKIMSLWSEVVGERIGENAQPKEVRNGILFVATASSTWAEELTFLKSNLREQLNKRVGKRILKDIRFVAGGFVRPEEGPKEKEGEEENLSVADLAEIRNLVKDIPGPDLKEKVRGFFVKEALYKQKMRSKKGARN